MGRKFIIADIESPVDLMSAFFCSRHPAAGPLAAKYQLMAKKNQV
jgi:hypothetical protein